ncbi:MAG: glycerol-3-phosphate dehydrogenase [Marinobacterium sp.]
MNPSVSPTNPSNAKIGAGVNGAGIAMDAAGRGLSTVLIDMDDLGAATSSNSSKLIHGGLRYLEHYEFRLVKEALAERESLLRNSPHIMWPLRFILPHRPHLRPAWMIRIGLFLYDNLAKRETLRSSEGVRFDTNSDLKQEIKRGFKYSDGWVDDARLVVNCSLAAQQQGADILPRNKVISARRIDNIWQIELADQVSGEHRFIQSKTLVNAAGPWVSKLFNEALEQRAPKEIRMVKGSHMVVPKIYDHEEAYILQNEDNRIVFVIPYEDDYSLIGTTDVDFTGDPKKATISSEEVDYLLGVVNFHFKKQLTSADMVWSYSGVRPLMDDEGGSAQKASRDYTFEVDEPAGEAPLLSVFGGKITTYRKLAEAATNAICKHFPEAKAPWTKTATMPGGDFDDHQSLNRELQSRYPWLTEDVRKRYVRTYGTFTHNLLEGVNSIDSMGQHFGGTLYACEVNYLIQNEWAMTAEDVLWRRTKQGLRINLEQKLQLENYISLRLNTSLSSEVTP